MKGSWLIVFGAVALFGASALPSGANDIPKTVKPADEPSKPAKDPTPPKPSSDDVKAVVVKPVNERYPHAVLYGGTCGGTIIGPKWVITAGHCVAENIEWSDTFVLAGTNNSDDGSGVSRKVKKQYLHPLYTVGPYWLDAKIFGFKQVAARWDFLLAELSEPLPLDGKTMAAAKLNDQPTLPVGLKVDYAGYGTDHFGGYMRNQMHGMELEVQSDDVCKVLEQYNPKDMLCAKGRPPRFDSACSGDSGSGLVDETGRLVGITSWVENDARNCSSGSLVVFARVSSVRDWIKKVTNI